MANHIITVLQKDIKKATSTDIIDVDYVFNELYPRAIAVLSEVETVEDVNIIRHGLEAMVTVTNRHIPKWLKNRGRRLRSANKGNNIYLQACIVAGRMWMATEKHRGRPSENNREESVQELTLLPKITAEEAGFTSTRDAQRCVKAAQIHDEDYRTYREECDRNGRQYTLTGLESVYDHLNPKEKKTPKTSLHKRLSGIVDKLTEWRHETGTDGDVYILITDAIYKLEDAVEIQKDIEDG